MSKCKVPFANGYRREIPKYTDAFLKKKLNMIRTSSSHQPGSKTYLKPSYTTYRALVIREARKRGFL